MALVALRTLHFFDRDALWKRLVDDTEEGQFEILEEILRLEPVAGMLRRRAAERVARVAQFDRDLRPNVTASCNEPSSKAGNAKCVRSQPLSPAKA